MVRLNRLDLALLGLILVLGAINLPQPFSSDQALFALGGRKLAAGGVLYRDFWDVKQPAIYQFYRAGGALFGFSETGIHLFELLYLMLFSLVITISLRDWFEHRWASGLAALATVGTFYAFTGDWHLTQVEGLVGFPLFLAAWLAARAGSSPPGSRPTPLLLTGVASGVVLLFKLIFAPIVGAFWLIALIARRRARADSRALGQLKDLGWIALGVALALAPTIIDMAAHHTLGLALWTFFQYPARLMEDPVPFRLHWLADGVEWFFPRWSPLLALGVVGALWPARGYRRLLSVNLVIWFVLGLAVILAQPLSFFQYHFLLLVVPVGILGTRGIDALAAAATRSGLLAGRAAARIAVVGCVLFLSTWAIGTALYKTAVLAHHGFALTPEQRDRYQQKMSRDDYASVRHEVAFLSAPGARPGPVFVLGHPLYNWLSGRDQGVVRHGSVVWGFASAGDYEHWTSELIASRTPYIFIHNGFAVLFKRHPERSESLLGEIARDYRVMRADTSGVWYEIRSDAGGTALSPHPVTTKGS